MSDQKTGYISEKTGHIITPTARASFVYLFKPQKAQEEGKPDSYSVTLLFPDDADLKILKTEAHKALVAKFGADKMNNTEFVAKLRNPFRDQGEFDYEGYVKGRKFIRASAQLDYKPLVVDTNGDEVIEARHVYSGCFVRAAVVPFAYDQKGNKGVSFGVRMVQKIADGDPLAGGGGTPSDNFKPVEGAVAASGDGGAADSVFG